MRLERGNFYRSVSASLFYVALYGFRDQSNAIKNAFRKSWMKLVATHRSDSWFPGRLRQPSITSFSKLVATENRRVSGDTWPISSPEQRDTAQVHRTDASFVKLANESSEKIFPTVSVSFLSSSLQISSSQDRCISWFVRIEFFFFFWILKERSMQYAEK